MKANTGKLEDIGFYTLSDTRAMTSDSASPIQRAELLITDRCNFKCPYCRGVMNSVKGEMTFDEIKNHLDLLIDHRLQNVRFTGGEPTLSKSLLRAVDYCHSNGVKRIAISTNGTASFAMYKSLIDLGANDFSISLDGGCCSIGDLMSGGAVGAWNGVINNIDKISALTYVTVGMVFTEMNIGQCLEAVLFADSLGVSDIRVIPSAQYNQALHTLSSLPDKILQKYPILRYRINNIKNGISVRGLYDRDAGGCPLVIDDLAIAGKYHFPCVIYMREQGMPIGVMSSSFRFDRMQWFIEHNPHKDMICKNNCLDVCRDYNNKWVEFHK
jgi:MoaA/NifB/PqqE/SkfB family radical SAM enzyme